MHPTETLLPAVQARFATVLQQALALAPDEQAQLAEVMGRITGMTPQLALNPEDEDADREEQDREEAAEWLASIAGHRPRQRLRLIEDVLLRGVAGAGADLVEQARKELLDAHPAVAVGAAVERYASEHPVAMLAGLAGTVLAVAGAAGGFFKLVF